MASWNRGNSENSRCGPPVTSRVFLLLLLSSVICVASSAGDSEAAQGLDPSILLGIALIWIVAKVFGEIFERIGQPGVLGELIGGIILGNLFLFGITGFEHLKTDPVIAALAELGVIILLFEVGLESSVGEMLEVGFSSLLVAVLGVVVPFFLGWAVAAYFAPDGSTLSPVFIGATLCATSVGITARVLKDLGRTSARESRIILGAAVIDDVLGLIVLAVLTGIIASQATGAAISWAGFLGIAGKAILFFVGAIIANRLFVVPLFRGAGKLEGRGVLVTISLAFCFLLAWAAARVQLAPIVGAFAAGLLLEDAHFKSFPERGKKDLHDLVMPVSFVLVPIFFVLMGLKVDLREFTKPGLLGFASILTVTAIAGKQICSLGVVERGLNRLAVGVGMVPRGEVGLIFAGIGSTMKIRNAEGVMVPVINSSTFGAVVIMVIVTTLVTPPALKWAMGRKKAATPAKIKTRGKAAEIQ
jgi:Kef-type K+ transport system membrane component KefB